MTDQHTMPAGPLAGIRVLDFTTMMSGPLCTRMLADMGADVVKVESPTGDHTRKRTPVFGGTVSRYFDQLNAGKSSIVLDLKDAGDRRTALRLAERTDVVIENNRPGVMARLELDYATVAEANPSVIYCAVSGYGQSGPGAGAAAYAPNINAASGFDMANMRYQPGADRPQTTAIFVADAMSAVYACAAIEGALLGRLRTGCGQFIDLALCDAMLALQVYEMQIAQTGEDPVRSLFHPMPTTDRFISIAAVTPKQFEALAAAIGRPEIVTDPRWSEPMERERNWAGFMEILTDWTRQRSAAECIVLLDKYGVGAALYRTPAEALADPQTQARGVLVDHEDAGGTYHIFNQPFQFADGSVRVRGKAPELGSDGERIRSTWLNRQMSTR